METFKQYIKKFEKFNNPSGDLARDIKDDKKFPVGSSKRIIENYLAAQGACYDALEIYKAVYALYKEDAVR